MKKIAVCKNDILSPNFKKDKIYYYEYDDNKKLYYITDDFSINYTFDEKWQTDFQSFFNRKVRNILFDTIFYKIDESRRLKLIQLSKNMKEKIINYIS